MWKFIALALLLAVGAARAETGYVTDQLSLGLHNASDTSDRPFRMLKSGDSFDIISREGYYAHIRLADGTTGYVKANFIVTEPPAAFIVRQTADERDRLAAELADLRSAFAEPAERMAELQAGASAARSEADAANALVAELQASNEDLVERQARYAYSLPYSWVGGAALICLVAGVLLGAWWTDRQSRRRHGGIRVV